MEYVNHPKHYNEHPNGIECIDIIRHYTCDIANAIKYLWRAGLKPEMGKEDAEKEIEDLKKALWYIEDFIEKDVIRYDITSSMDYSLAMAEAATGYKPCEIIGGYEPNVGDAIWNLLPVGIQYNGQDYTCKNWREKLNFASKKINAQILFIEHSLLDKEIKETVDVLRGKAIDGEDYVSKPGCVRETEPEDYDPLNMIVIFGRVYSLADKIRKKDNGALYSPCENCSLWSECHEWQDMPTCMLKESKCHYLCVRLHNADTNDYYREVGVAKYSPKFGIVEVVDELKESELELKRLQEEQKKESKK